jgi:hypothetical protein
MMDIKKLFVKTKENARIKQIKRKQSLRDGSSWKAERRLSNPLAKQSWRIVWPRPFCLLFGAMPKSKKEKSFT